MTNSGKRRLSRPTVPPKPVSLRALAEYLGLSPTTVSVVVSDSPAGKAISVRTKKRVLEAARRLDYRPNFYARSLSIKRGFTVGILAPELLDGYYTLVMSGVGDRLIREGYTYFSAHHGHKPNLIEEYGRLIVGRGAEGIIAIDTALQNSLPVPVVAVGGHRKIAGITNVVVDHKRAAELVLCHLHELGHQKIAFMREQPFISDSDQRWVNIVAAARELRIQITPALVVALEHHPASPALGYQVIQHLLEQRCKFTALVALNDMSAIGAIRALCDQRLVVPDEVSVVGFDDIQFAGFSIPRLTTIRQPLYEMGETAARLLIERLRGKKVDREVLVTPELIVRETTAPQRSSTKRNTLKIRAGSDSLSIQR